MSECVVRMEMPEDCFECPFGIIDDTEDGVWCNALAQQSSGQREDCPIICSLPEGHGRLVDISPLDVIAFRDKDCSFYAGVLSVCERIDKLPTIVPADTAERSDHEAD